MMTTQGALTGLAAAAAMWTLRTETRTEGKGDKKETFSWYQLTNVKQNYAAPQRAIYLQKIKKADDKWTPIWTACSQSDAEEFYTDYHNPTVQSSRNSTLEDTQMTKSTKPTSQSFERLTEATTTDEILSALAVCCQESAGNNDSGTLVPTLAEICAFYPTMLRDTQLLTFPKLSACSEPNPTITSRKHGTFFSKLSCYTATIDHLSSGTARQKHNTTNQSRFYSKKTLKRRNSDPRRSTYTWG